MRDSAVFLWSDRALFIGDRSVTDLHRHHAIELALALDEAGLQMTTPQGPELRKAPGALVRSDTWHQLAIPGPKVAVLYVDPASPAGAGLTAWLDHRALAALPTELLIAHRQQLHDLFRADASLHDAARTCQAIVDAVAPHPPRPKLDRRLRKALEILEAELENPPGLGQIAAQVNLSPSRFGHLFSQQIGLPLRQYILWLRLRSALTEALSSGDMTSAAHRAGFADAAHFSRTCKRMFGLPPSAFAPVDVVLVGS